jgi:hypothetical protein
MIAGRVPVSASRLLNMALSPRSSLWEQLRGSTATFTADLPCVSSVNLHCGRYVYKKQMQNNHINVWAGVDTTVIRYDSWSISLPALSRASRYFSDTIGIPILTACRVPRSVADIKHSRLQVTPRRLSFLRGAEKQAGSKRIKTCWRSRTLLRIHCGVAATNSGDLTNALGVSFDGLVVRYQLPRYHARQRLT